MLNAIHIEGVVLKTWRYANASFAQLINRPDPGVGGVCGPNVSTNSNPINGTHDDPLFQGEVWGHVVCQVDHYGQPLLPGQYRVNLYFAEIWWGPGCPAGSGGVGDRVFDIDSHLNSCSCRGKVNTTKAPFTGSPRGCTSAGHRPKPRRIHRRRAAAVSEEVLAHTWCQPRSAPTAR